MNAPEVPTLQARVQVHRMLEWTRLHGLWPEREALQMNAEAAIQEAGIGMPDDHAARGLLVAELVAWVEDRWRSGQDDLPGEAVGELCEPVDPTGELEGGRPVTGQLLYRRVDGKGPHGVHRDERGGGLSRTDIGGGKMPA